MEKLKKTMHNNAYDLWRVNGSQQDFRYIASFGFAGTGKSFENATSHM
jgi:hypothetical protein